MEKNKRRYLERFRRKKNNGKSRNVDKYNLQFAAPAIIWYIIEGWV